MKRIYYFFRSFIPVNYCWQCQEFGLNHVDNVWGMDDCRSIWVDEFGNYWRCKERY